jgi:toxin ParE1/3/4
VIVRWSPRAIERVVEIGEWIASDHTSAASQNIEGIFAAVERLTEFPRSGRVVPEFERDDLREVIYQQFRIVYRVGAEYIDVLTVRHSLQLMNEADLGG